MTTNPSIRERLAAIRARLDGQIPGTELPEVLHESRVVEAMFGGGK